MKDTAELKKIEVKESEIEQEAEKIERAEKRISEEEHRILEAEQTILSNTKKSGVKSLFDSDLTSPERYLVRMMFVRKLARHKLLFSLLVTIGIVLVWRGIWHTADEIPGLSIAIVSFIVGIIILWAINRYTDLR